MSFTFDVNPGATRFGTLTVDGLPLTVTQAGATYAAAPFITLFSYPQGIPTGVAVDGAGNVYIADYADNAIKEWSPATGATNTLVAPGAGLNSPYGVAVDTAGNVYIADGGNSAIKKWTATTQSLSILVAAGLVSPYGVAVDGAGNVYIADSGNNTIKEWLAASGTVITLVSSGLNTPGRWRRMAPAMSTWPI